MENFRKEKISAIVPAVNEEKNVGRVLAVLLESRYFDEVILVDDGSTDKTADVGEKFGVRVVKIEKNKGKGNAMRVGANSTDAEIIVFFDADLIGLSQEHICLLVDPLLRGDAGMCVGIRDHAVDTSRWGHLMALGGERAIKKSLFEKIPEKDMQGFAVETAINHYCAENKILVEYIILKNLSIIIKEKKWGFLKGFLSRLKMIFEIVKIRIKILCIKKQH